MFANLNSRTPKIKEVRYLNAQESRVLDLRGTCLLLLGLHKEDRRSPKKGVGWYLSSSSSRGLRAAGGPLWISSCGFKDAKGRKSSSGSIKRTSLRAANLGDFKLSKMPMKFYSFLSKNPANKKGSGTKCILIFNKEFQLTEKKNSQKQDPKEKKQKVTFFQYYSLNISF